ncbi:MAG: N-acetylmuramoyl-L-alanine amidase, partial [Muribaculaceae bacterium]|nr:N-acetylmuramoyl-L-alanine amidase [Muribaculaceae bacterium]
MKITQNLLTPNKYSRPQIPLKNVRKIAVHYVGNPGTSAAANRNYFENQKTAARYVSSHFVVGLNGEIIQCVPLDEISYCTNQANTYSVSIECCHPDSTGKFTAATENSLAELCAYLLEKFGLCADDIIRHYDVTGKQCPLYWSPTKYQSAETANARFSAFKEKVRLLMSTSKSGGDFRVRVLDGSLNIRRTPSLTAPITGVITDKGVYTITAEEQGDGVLWGRLKSGAGWISLGSNYVPRRFSAC